MIDQLYFRGCAYDEWYFVPVLARAVQMLIFVGFLEEFFFRGYLQSRFNDAFGRPYRFAGVAFGAGLFVLPTAFFSP